MGETKTRKIEWEFVVDGHVNSVISRPGEIVLYQGKDYVKLPHDEEEIQELLNYIQEEQQNLVAGEKTDNGIIENSFSDYFSKCKTQYRLVQNSTSFNLIAINPDSFVGTKDGVAVPAGEFQLWLDYLQRTIDKAVKIREHRENDIIEISNSNSQSLPF